MTDKFRNILIISFGMLLVLIITVLLIVRSREAVPQANEPLLPAVPEEAVKCERTSRIDGLCQLGTDSYVYSVMIDNHSVARPASGLSQASLVFEAIAESPITRFEAFFSSDEEVPKIGPIRSARPYFVRLSREFNGPYLHVGGSNEAIDLIDNILSFDLNEFYNGKYFWRDNLRFAPHNTYTSSEKVTQAVAAKGWELKGDFSPWQFKEEAKLEIRPATESVRVNYNAPSYNIVWEYDRAKNDYQRYQGGDRQVDALGVEIRAKNVAVMYAASSVIDDYGRRETEVIGSGKALIYRDGVEVVGEWRRPSLESRTRFYDSAGTELAFNAGTTWVEILPE